MFSEYYEMIYEHDICLFIIALLFGWVSLKHSQYSFKYSQRIPTHSLTPEIKTMAYILWVYDLTLGEHFHCCTVSIIVLWNLVTFFIIILQIYCMLCESYSLKQDLNHIYCGNYGLFLWNNPTGYDECQQEQVLWCGHAILHNFQEHLQENP